MSLLLTDLDIVNAACAAYGDDPIQSLGEETAGGQAVQLIYEDTVEFNLGIYVFSFAKEIRQLSTVDGATPLSGYSTVFDVPAEALGAPLYITDDPTDPDRRFNRYVPIGSTIHADANPLFAMIRFRPAVRRWSPTFKSATIAAVASKLAVARADATTVARELHVEAYGTPSDDYHGGKMGAAIKADSFSTPPRKAAWGENPLSRSRF